MTINIYPLCYNKHIERGIPMDEFLRDIHTIIFKQWLLYQKADFYDLYLNEKDQDVIIIENEFCYSYITFNPQDIIELCVMNKITDEMEFYLHFQFKTLKHAISLFHEMTNCIKKIVNKPKCRILLCCSGGMTTEFFAQKIRDAIQILSLNIEVAAVGYQKLYQEGLNYDVILLAPQVSYVSLQVEKVLKNQLVLKIPPQVFAKYNVGALITFVDEALSQRERKKTEYIEPLFSVVKLSTDKNILAVSINSNGDNSHISYRLYQYDQSIILDSKIIKHHISLQDVLDAIDTVLLQNEKVDVIGIALPGVIVDGFIHSGIIDEMKNKKLTDILEERYHKPVFIINDVNAAAVGYYASQKEHQSLSMLFQPINRMAGAAVIINGQLIKGFGGLAGEVQLLPLQLSDDYFRLANTPEGTLELVTKQILSIIAIVSPEEIIIYSDLIFDSKDVEREIKKSLSGFHLTHFPHIIKIENLVEYTLLGIMNLCIQE